jgi:single-strand DNA-binding protein
MKGVNKVILVGSLGADPETRYSSAGAAITNIRVAVNEQWKDKSSGEMQKRTEWIRIKFFGRLAEIAGEYLKKGSQVYIEGKLRTEEYEKDGIKRYSTDVIADEMQMLGGKPDGASNPQRSSGKAPAREAQPTDQFESDEIPF